MGYTGVFINNYKANFELSNKPLFFSDLKLGFADCPSHIHRHIEVQYIYDKSARFAVDGKNIELRTGLLFVFPYRIHSSEYNGDCQHISFNFLPNEFPEYERILTRNIPLSPFVPSDQLPPTFDAMIHYAEKLYFDDDFPLREKLLHSVVSVVIGEALSSMTLISRENEKDTGTIPAIGRVVEYCMNHLSDDLSLDTVSEALFLDKYYISKLFPAKLGVGYAEFIRSQRIIKACELLRMTDKPITDISYECGFRNQSTFNRIFREMAGMSPREYRTDK